MSTDATSIRLPPKDAAMLDHFVKSGEFKSRSELIRYAIKKTINELVLKEFQESMGEDGTLSEKEIDTLAEEIKSIRKKLWKDYAKHLS